MAEVEFQKDVLAYFINNPDKMTSLPLDTSGNIFFTSPTLNKIYEIISHNYVHTGTIPAEQEFQNLIRIRYCLTPQHVQEEYLTNLYDVYNRDVTHTTFETLSEIIVRESLKSLHTEIFNENITTNSIIKNIEDKIGQIKNIGEDDDIGFLPLTPQNVSNRSTLYDEMYGGNPIQTGLVYIDQHIRGYGLRPGDLFVIMGYTGGGKTAYLIDIITKMIRAGHRVIYYILDNHIMEIVERIDTNLMNRNINDEIEMGHYVSVLQERVKDIDPTLFICKHVMPYRKNIDYFDRHVDRVENTYGKVDVVIFDSGDHITASRKYNEKRHDLETVYAEIRGLAWKKQLRAISTTQGNRKALTTDIITGDHISEAYSKMWASTLFVTISMTPEEKLNGRARLVIIKNTKGPSNVICPVLFNVLQMRINCDMSSQPTYYLGSRTQRRTNDSEAQNNSQTSNRDVPALVFGYQRNGSA